TVRLMTRDAPRTSPLAARAALLQGATMRGDPFRVDVSLTQGYLDPLALMTFKVLPQWYKIKNEEEFAEKPIGSGPYIFGGVHSEAGRAYARFLANPNYSSRPSKFGL